MRTALVAGAAGFLGSNLTELLLKRGYRVYGLDNFATSGRSNLQSLLENSNFEFFEASVLEQINYQFPHRLDSVFHLASPASPPKYTKLGLETVRANTIGTENLIHLSFAHSAKFVFASTSEVYGDPLEYPQKETYWGNVNPIGPRSVYDESKRLGETLVSYYHHEQNLDAVIVRIFNTFGPGMDPFDGRVVSNFIRQGLFGEPLTVYGSGKQTRSFCYVDDLVSGIMMASESEQFGPINLGNPTEFTVLELAEIVSNSLGVPIQTDFYPLPKDDPRQRCPDISLAKAKLGWQPTVPLSEGLPMTISWIKDQLSNK